MTASAVALLGWLGAQSLQVGLLAAVAWLLDCLLRRRGWPDLRAALWVAVCAKALLPGFVAIPILVPAAIAQLPLLDGPGTASMAPAVCAIWLAGALGSGVGLVRRHRGATARLLRDAIEPVPAHLQHAAVAAAEALGFRRTPELRLCRHLTSPLLVGLLRPRILLPAALAGRGASERLHHVLLHEIAHLQRKDAWMAAGVQVVLALFWFHPALWLARARLHELREIGCDLAVARVLGQGTAAYRRTLAALTLARPEADARALAIAAMPAQIFVRLAILAAPRRAGRLAMRLPAAALTGILLCCAPLRAPADPWAEFAGPAATGLAGCMQLRFLVLREQGREARSLR